jgi:hypothetical protein
MRIQNTYNTIVFVTRTEGSHTQITDEDTRAQALFIIQDWIQSHARLLKSKNNLPHHNNNNNIIIIIHRKKYAAPRRRRRARLLNDKGQAPKEDKEHDIYKLESNV